MRRAITRRLGLGPGVVGVGICQVICCREGYVLLRMDGGMLLCRAVLDPGDCQVVLLSANGRTPICLSPKDMVKSMPMGRARSAQQKWLSSAHRAASGAPAHMVKSTPAGAPQATWLARTYSSSFSSVSPMQLGGMQGCCRARGRVKGL